MTTETTNTKAKLHTSAAGTIKFSALREARKEQDKNGEPGRSVYSMRLEVEASTAGADTLRTLLEDVNDKLIVTKVKNMKLAPGNFIFNAKSINKPKVYDKNMELIASDLIPMIESGTAKVIFTTFEGKSGKGGGINLVGVQLLDYVEFQGNSAIDEADIVAQLKASQ